MESQYPNRIRYLTIVSAFGQDEEEQSIVMGVDWTDKYVKQVLHLPTLMPWPVYKWVYWQGNPEVYLVPIKVGEGGGGE